MQTQHRREYHPAVSILSWLAYVVAVENSAWTQMLWVALTALLLLAERQTWNRFARLVWKARWLWVTLLALHAWSVPGILLFPFDWSPTLQGIQAGLIRIVRLLFLLAALARLMSELAPQQIAAGLYLLSRPLGWLGLDRRALAVRLALTLEQMEKLPERKLSWRANWLETLQSPSAQAEGKSEMVLHIPRVSALDIGVLFAALALLTWVAR